MFFFGAIEQQREDVGRFVPENLFNEFDVLVRATNAGQLPPGFVNPDHPRIGEQPGGLLTYSLKGTAQLNNAHSLMFRYSGQHENRDSVTWLTNNDDSQPDDFRIDRVQRGRSAQLGAGELGPEPDHGAGEPHRLSRRRVEQGHRRALHAGLPERRYLRASPRLPVGRHRSGRRRRNAGQPLCVPDQGRRVAAAGQSRAQARSQFQPALPPGHPERQRALRDVDLLRRPVGDRHQHPAGIHRASRRPASSSSGSRPTAASSTARDTGRIPSTPCTSSRRGSRTTGARRRN